MRVEGFLVVLKEDETQFVRDLAPGDLWVAGSSPLGPPLFFVDEPDARAYISREEHPELFTVIPASLSYGKP